MGREVTLPAELVFKSTNTLDEEITSYGDYVDSLRTRIQHAHEIARKHMSTAAKRSKDLYNAKVAFYRYSVGDVVWCLMGFRKVGIFPKLERISKGTFLIRKKLSEIDFVLQLDKSGTERPVHHNNLEPYEDTDTPKLTEPTVTQPVTSAIVRDDSVPLETVVTTRGSVVVVTEPTVTQPVTSAIVRDDRVSRVAQNNAVVTVDSGIKISAGQT